MKFIIKDADGAYTLFSVDAELLSDQRALPSDETVCIKVRIDSVVVSIPLHRSMLPDLTDKQIWSEAEPVANRMLPLPGEFNAFCERCREHKQTCLNVSYQRPPLLTPAPTEIVVGVDDICERPVIDLDDIRIPHAIMCRECRKLNERFRQPAD